MSIQNLPAGYQRILLYWFKCPSCGRESSTAIMTVPVPHNLQTLYRFWCADCGGHAVLKYPKRKGWVVLGTLGLVALVFLGFAPNWIASAMAVSVVGPIVWAGLNRATNDYVPDRSVWWGTGRK